MATYRPEGPVGLFVHRFEELALAFMLGVMTLLTFVNVVLRYAFNSLLVWSLETVTILYAWMVLFGIAYGIKVSAHLGVDLLIGVLGRRARKIMALMAGVVCLAFGLLFLKGAWDYWAPFAGLDRTSGQWFPTGFVETRSRSYIETGQIPFPEFLRFLEPSLLMEGDPPFQKLPVVIPYVILPISAVLIVFRLCQAIWQVATGTRSSFIASHEAEDQYSNQTPS